MDSLTQIVLGAAVGEATLGRKIGNKAILWGAIAGTIPDLDVFVKHFTDPISANLMHRGLSHSLLFCLVMSPILAYLARRFPKVTIVSFFAILAVFFLTSGASYVKLTIVLVVFGLLSFWVIKRYKHEDVTSYKRWVWMFFLCLVTHPLLDCHTDWGTQFFWPFEYRIAYKNIFVADPLYTLPFLIFLIIAMCFKRTNPKRRLFNNIGLIVSSFYMALSLFFKGYTYAHFQDELHRQEIEYVEMDTRPTPLNTLLWNAQIETKTGYIFGYYSLLDTDFRVQFSKEFPKNKHVMDSLGNPKVLKQLEKFSSGWYRFHYEGDSLFFTDIRFGQMGMDVNESPFVWQYHVYTDENGVIRARERERNISDEQMNDAVSGLWKRSMGINPIKESRNSFRVKPTGRLLLPLRRNR